MIRRLAMLWVYLYTAGLTEAQKGRRRREIQSDMYEELRFAVEQGGSAAISGSIASRTARGMLADVLWRLEEGRDGEGVARTGAVPPLPWFTMWFVVAVIVYGCLASTQAEVLGDTRVMLAFLGAAGAGLFWLGLVLVTRHLLGRLCITVGTVFIALGLWWTIALPLIAVCFGISGLRRAQRLDALFGESA